MRVFPPSACADRTFLPDKRHAVGFATDFDRLSDISGTAAARTVLRIHSSPSVGLSVASKVNGQEKKWFLLRNPNKMVLLNRPVAAVNASPAKNISSNRSL